MRVSRSLLLVLVFSLTLLGCASVKRSMEAYEACKADTECVKEILKIQDSTYVVTKAAASGAGFPSVPEVLAVLVSNLAAFGQNGYCKLTYSGITKEFTQSGGTVVQ